MPTPQELAMALRQSTSGMGGMSDQERQMMMAGQQMAAQPQAWQGAQGMGAMTDQERMMMQAAQRQQPMTMPQQNYSMGNSGTSSMGSVPMGQTMPNNSSVPMGRAMPQRDMMQSERGLTPQEAAYLQSLSR
jgi:hypothetical protein